MKPASGSRFGRNRFRIVYVNRFGSHRCGTVIHYSSGHLRQEGKADTISCIPNKAHSPISNGPGSRCAVLPPSPEGQKSPSFGPGANSKMQADETGIGASQPLSKERQAKSPKAAKAKRIMAELPCPPNKDWGCQVAALSPSASSNQKKTGGYHVTQSDVFEFSTPLENANNMIRKRKKKSAVWCGVSKVISKMIEENGHFRDRLIHCSQLSSKKLVKKNWKMHKNDGKREDSQLPSIKKKRQTEEEMISKASPKTAVTLVNEGTRSQDWLPCDLCNTRFAFQSCSNIVYSKGYNKYGASVSNAGRDVNENAVNGASCIDTDEAIFGWV